MRWPWLNQLLAIEPVDPPPVGVPAGEAFELHARVLTARNMKLVALFIMVSGLLCLALDPLVLGHDPHVVRRFAEMRVGSFAIGAIGYLALLPAPLARRPLAPGLGMAVAGGILLGYYTGRVGGLDAPWFHFTYAVCISLLAPVVSLPWRALSGVVLPASLFAGFSLARPLVPAPPALAPTIAFLIFMGTAGVAIGHIVYRLVRRGFFHARAEKKVSLELEALNETLEERVRAQTRELRMLAAHLESAREDERARIARELHDELGQELAALRYTMTFLRQRFERDPKSIRSNLDELDTLLGRTATTTRQILSDLRPRILDDLGLVAGIEWLVQRTEERTGLSSGFSAPAPRLDLDPRVSIAAFRIVQESLTNVARHAQATRVDVEITVEDRELRLIVRDDGIGMEDGSVKGRSRGMGLVGIRERAEALGGELHLDSAPGRGTAVRVRLPIEERRDGVEVAA